MVSVHSLGEDNSSQELQVWAYSRFLLGAASYDSLAWSVLMALPSWSGSQLAGLSAILAKSFLLLLNSIHYTASPVQS